MQADAYCDNSYNILYEKKEAIQEIIEYYYEERCDKRDVESCDTLRTEINKKINTALLTYNNYFRKGCFDTDDEKYIDIGNYFEIAKLEKDDSIESGAQLANISSFCSSSNYQKITKFIGWAISVVKVLVPVLLLIFGLIDFYKAVMASKDDALSKSMKTFIIRVAAAILIFFLPSMITFIFTLIDDWNKDYETNYRACTICLSDPNNC